MNSTLRALNRFGLGARVGERRRIGDPRGWLRAQLKGGAPRAFRRRPKPLPPPSATPSARFAWPARRIRRSGSRRAGGWSRSPPPRAAPRSPRASPANGRSSSGSSRSGRITCACPSARRCSWRRWPAATSARRSGRTCSAASRTWCWRRRSIPAMLVYLDNFQSIGPTLARRARPAAAAAAQRGLNENYARELLELHTLGVDGGYTQQDVQELAKILTGWTVGGLARAGAMQSMRPRARRQPMPASRRIRTARSGSSFQELLHEPGAKTVLGARYGEAGVEEGERAIRALCRHPSTARFVATKLVTHFVSDDPPAGCGRSRRPDVPRQRWRSSRGCRRADRSAGSVGRAACASSARRRTGSSPCCARSTRAR